MIKLAPSILYTIQANSKTHRKSKLALQLLHLPIDSKYLPKPLVIALNNSCQVSKAR